MFRRLVLTTIVGVSIGVLPAVVGMSGAGASQTDCRNYGYACTPGYTGSNAAGTWAWNHYGASNAVTANGYHNCTLYAAWRLEQNGMPDPGNWGNAVDWVNHTVHNSTPAVGSIAWWGAEVPGGLGHVAYVDEVSGSQVHVVADNWSSATTGGYTDSGSIAASTVDAFLHPWDLPTGGPNAITVARNADGRLEAFGVNTQQPQGTNNTYHDWQVSPGGSWSGWHALSPGYVTSISVAQNKDGRLEAVGANADQPQGTSNTYHDWQVSPGGSWSGWHALSPGYVTSISVAQNKDGRLEAVGANADQPQGTSNTYHDWQVSPGGSWSGWHALSPGYVTSISVAQNKDGRLEAVGANADQPQGTSNTYHDWQVSPGGSWSGWYGLSPGYVTSISVAQNKDGRLEVVGANADQPQGTSNTYHDWQVSPGGSWSGWYGLSPGYVTSIAVGTNADGRLEAVGANADQPQGTSNTYHDWQVSPGGWWSGWYGLSPGYIG